MWSCGSITTGPSLPDPAPRLRRSFPFAAGAGVARLYKKYTTWGLRGEKQTEHTRPDSWRWRSRRVEWRAFLPRERSNLADSPTDIAEQVVELALQHGDSQRDVLPPLIHKLLAYLNMSQFAVDEAVP